MAISLTKEASSSSSSTPPHSKSDVFLSFRGTDTRKNFISHLSAALKRHGISTFKDDTELERGEFISSKLLKAIDESRIALIVFSKNYATSRWCLDELVKIMECKKIFQQIVLPIFYEVDPSDVRNQKGSLAEAFAKHGEHFNDGSNGNKVEKWKAALTEAANLSGWDLNNMTNGHEAKFIEKIVEEIGTDISSTDLNVASHPIGLKSRLENLNALVSMDSNDVRIVGIWGIGGIGKTTIAKMRYNLIHHKFEGSSFLANVRESWEQTNGPAVLQNQLFHDIVKNDTHTIRSTDQGIEVIKRRVLCRRVLLVLDDVDNVQQLKALAIDRDFFRLGSRIIITTRNKGCLNFIKVDWIYEPKNLNMDESLQLFSWYAFKEDHPLVDYVGLSNQVVNYAGGLPLALEVLGSYFGEIGNDIGIWESAIEKLTKVPHDDIQGKLKISYDSLDKTKKKLFLDIACFLVGMDRDFVIKILEGRICHTKVEIEILATRCLVKFGHQNKLKMHDMIRDMGREIVKQENEELGKRSRLWYREDILEVLRYGTGFEEVEGLSLNFPESKEVQANAKAFDKMNGLWLLHLNYVHLRSGFEHIFRKLLWLSWKCCPLEWLPSKLYMEKLVALDLRYSRLKQVWKGTKNLYNLKFLYLSHCHYLIKTPDFSGLNSLKELLIDNCASLVEIDESIGCLNKLLVLDMANCEKLRHFPLKILMLESLEYLDISGCSKLKELGGFKGSLSKLLCTFFSSWSLPRKNVDSISLSLVGSSCLKTLKMAECNLLHLPTEIGNLISLVDLDVSYNNLDALPDSISNLTSLQNLNMAYNNVSHLSSKIGGLISLRHLDLTGNSLCILPESIGSLTHLESLKIGGCNISHLPSEIGRLISLKKLSLQGNDLCSLPESICDLACLQNLSIQGCNVPRLPNKIGSLISLTHLDLQGNNLCALPDSICNLACLQQLFIGNCNLSKLPSEFGRLISLERLYLDGNNLYALPDAIFNLSHLKCLRMAGCNLSHLPNEIGRLNSLETLDLSRNNLYTLPDSICNLHELKNLLMYGCNLSHLPSGIWRVKSLVHLNVDKNNFQTLPDGIYELTNLKDLSLTNCARLHSIPKLPISVTRLYASGCVSLENIELPWQVGGNAWFVRFMDISSCPKLAENNFANNFIKVVFQQFKDVLALRSSNNIIPVYCCSKISLCGVDFPRWFEYQSTGSYLSFKVPPLINQKILGLLLCIVPFRSKNLPVGSENRLVDVYVNWLVRRNKVVFAQDCYLAFCWPLLSGKEIMWLQFLPTIQFKGGDEVELSIRTNEPIQFKKFAANLVDENITEKNDEALTQYTSSPYPSIIQEEEKEKEVDYPAKKKKKKNKLIQQTQQ